MKTLLFLLACTVFLTASALAEVKDGDYYKCGPNGIVKVSCHLNPIMNTVDVKFTRDGSDSNQVTGTPGPSGGNTCQDSPIMTQGTGENQLKCRVKNGRWQYQNDNGDWIDAGCPRPKPKEETPVPL